MGKRFGTDLAKHLGLSSPTTKGPFRGGCAVGDIDGYPLVAGLIKKQDKNGVLIHIRWIKDSLAGTAEQLKERIATSPEILAAMEKSSLSKDQLKNLTVDGEGIVLFWQYGLRQPSLERVASLVRSLVAIAKSSAQPVGTDCEVCRQRAGDLYLVNGVELHRLCVSDRQRAEATDNSAVEAYRALPSRPLVGLLFGTVAAIVAALVWAGIALAIHRVFGYVALAIGLVIGIALFRGAGKIDLFGRFATVALTIGAVFLGQFVYVVVSVANAAHVPVTLELASRVAERFIAVEFAGSSGFIVLVFALIGSLAVFWVFRNPVRSRRFDLVTSST